MPTEKQTLAQKLNLRLRFAVIWLTAILPCWLLVAVSYKPDEPVDFDLILFLVLSTAISAIMTVLMFTATRSDIKTLITIIENFSHENYQARNPGSKEGIFFQAITVLNRLGRKLTRNQHKVIASTDEIYNASLELSKLASQGQTSSEMQNKAIVHIASSAEEMSSSIASSAETAQQGADISRTSNQLAIKSEEKITQLNSEIFKINNAVTGTIKKVENLQENSQKIGAIVSSIQDITDQTNLLALNAAIESARAGEQGKGFAVVSEEVRNLARRTADSSREITQIISTVQQDVIEISEQMKLVKDSVETGVTSAHETEHSLSQIQENANHQLEVVNGIASALMEQKQASSQVASKIENIAEQASENDNTIQQTSATATYLAKLATNLNKIYIEN